ncbi:unnamed protein product [Bursaphelenchus okinawaensis]|uniref:Phosphatidylserine synthase n=1 Tax=Bursaphelenchus okinawaensis TaxID=465554 RepID=A0A811LTF4_9BILA|nr:unnamed protein product [Bursaphelenchus okinawaensis]CAG9127697.1 unnamed protein product [Bursaphelenchus okinawaensis]
MATEEPISGDEEPKLNLDNTESTSTMPSPFSEVDGSKRRKRYTTGSDSEIYEGEFEDGFEDSDFERSRDILSRSRTDLERLHFRYVNERVVNDVTLEVFYKPHTISVLALLGVYLIYYAFWEDDGQTEHNVYFGMKAMGGLFLVISAMAFPNGPFVRPHPIIWRIVFGVSVLYVMLLQFTLFQTYDDIKKVLTWLDPKGLGQATLKEKDYAVNCHHVTLERLWGMMDIFAVGHFLGWAMKALLIRHSIICWYISIAWELTEIVFTHLLPNFQECWWDAIILDVLVCNGLGICFGMWVCRILEMRIFHWESVKNIRTAKGKFMRSVMQFTPESWIRVDWFNSFALRRCISIYAFIMIWLLSELNTFFLKHVFAVDTTHPVVFWRLILIALISAPSIRQYYLYCTDPKIKRLGMQCWVYLAVCLLEMAICVKFGRQILPRMKIFLITVWILILIIGTIGCIWLSVKWAKYSYTKKISYKGKTENCYLDSSTENLGAIQDDVVKRRKKLQIKPPRGVAKKSQ